MKISEIVKKGPFDYKHIYMQTHTSHQEAEHKLECPKTLKTINGKFDNAEAVIFGDDSLGIEIDGKLWAAEMPDPEMRPGVKLPSKVWHFINMAMGREEYCDTY